MITPATLTAVSLTTTNNNHNSSMNNNKRKRESTVISAATKKSTENRISNPQSNEIDNSFIRNISTFRIPKKARSNGSIPSEGNHQLTPSQMNESMPLSSPSSQVSNTKSNLSSNHHLNDDSNSQSGKRKFSLSQYKEHKRSKSNETTQNYTADIDMRMHTMENLRDSPPTAMDNESSIISNNQPVGSPKSNDINKDVVIKSNLSEPGVKKLIKKKLIWADEKNQALVHTSFFEIDDSEVVDIHAFARQCAANISIAQLERLMERDLRKRQNLQDINSFDNDDRQNLPPLPRLIPILLPDTLQIPVVKSQERLVQEEREKTVLQALLMRTFLLDSPGEPDGDLLGNSNNEPKTIPFDDNTPSSEANQGSSVNDADSTATNVPPASTIASSLSSLLLDKLSPEVAHIFAQAKENATSATVNNPSSTTVNTSMNQITPAPSINSTLAPVPNLLSVLLNMARPNGIETANMPPTNSMMNLTPNLPLNFNIPPPTVASINQLAANVLSLGLLPPPTFNNPVFQPSTITNPSTIRFATPSNQQSTRFNQNNNEHHMTNSRGNSRGRIYRRGLHNNNNYRRDYYQNRNNNRNIFS